MTIPIVIFMIGITARLLGRFGAKPLIVIGFAVPAAGVAGLRRRSRPAGPGTSVRPSWPRREPC
ncbi:hypothetical protein ACFYOK_31005 [Microbispora bryophytorum]|uniref:hypothetical protein n=1 Tax=Microbispora bryophytorum TaxID=1460882 RepID=UPI0033F61448